MRPQLYVFESWRFLYIIAAIALQSVPGLGDHSSTNSTAKAEAKSNSGKGHDVLFIFLGVAGIVLLAVFLYKLWQKKKREEQHARLLRLFEEDDELELELGLRD